MKEKEGTTCEGLCRFHISVSTKDRVRNDWRLEMESVNERKKRHGGGRVR